MLLPITMSNEIIYIHLDLFKTMSSLYNVLYLNYHRFSILMATIYFISEKILVVAAFFVVCKVLSLLQKFRKGAMVQDLVDLVATVHLQRFDAAFHEFALE